MTIFEIYTILEIFIYSLKSTIIGYNYSLHIVSPKYKTN